MKEGWNFSIHNRGCYVVTHHNVSIFHLHGKHAKITAEKHICCRTRKSFHTYETFSVEDDADM